MKKLLSTLLLIVMLCQILPFDALATVGNVLTDDELARAYALTGPGQHDGLYHNGMMPNASMSGMQLARWLESQLDNQVHTIDDVLARARYQLDVMIRMVLFGLDRCSTEVTGGFELSTGLTVFFVKFRKTWITKEYTIFSSVPADNSLLGHYMNVEKNAPKVVEAAHLDPQGYPELASEAKFVISETNAKASFKVVNVNNADYAFYLKRVTDKTARITGASTIRRTSPPTA